jgi:hypothetical protein
VVPSASFQRGGLDAVIATGDRKLNVAILILMEVRRYRGRQRRPIYFARRAVLCFQITHKQPAASFLESDVVDRQYSESETDLGANRIELYVKCSSVMLNSVIRTGAMRFVQTQRQSEERWQR